jgi:single-strand DNA-binding protein
MSGINKVIAIGRLGQDPDTKTTPTGSVVSNFSMAVSETWNDKKTGQKQERTEWIRVVVWGKLAELSDQYLRKGSQVYIEGKLSTRSWEDEEGNKRYTTEVNASVIQFLDSKKDSESSQQGKPVETDNNFSSDDIPF